MDYPWLTKEQIDVQARRLLHAAFGAQARERRVNLEELVCDYLSERDRLSFDDECDIPTHNGHVVLGRTLPITGKIEIHRVLKQDGVDGRYRFTVAHELGHWTLHRPLFLASLGALDLFEHLSDDSVLVSLERSVFPDHRQPVAREEWQANRFAIALLLDPEYLREEFSLRFNDRPVARRDAPWNLRSSTLPEHSALLARAEINGHPPLCDVFGLSAEALAIGLRQHGFAVEEAGII